MFIIADLIHPLPFLFYNMVKKAFGTSNIDCCYCPFLVGGSGVCLFFVLAYDYSLRCFFFEFCHVRCVIVMLSVQHSLVGEETSSCSFLSLFFLFFGS